MFNRVMLLALISMLCLAGCGGGEEEKPAQPAAAPAPAKKAEESVPVYELTKDNITSHEGWTSRNISVLGAKIGDKTTTVEKNLGKLDNTRTLPKTDTEPGYYLTIYQGNALFVFTVGLTGKLAKLEVYQNFAKQVADEKLKKLLTNWDIKSMHDVLGMEEGPAVESSDADSTSTEYPYDSRGFRFLRVKIKGNPTAVSAIRFFEPKKSS
jgi:hypothetical protein